MLSCCSRPSVKSRIDVVTMWQNLAQLVRVWDFHLVTPVIQDFTLGRLRRDDRMSPRALNSEGGNGGGGGGGRLPVSQSEAR